MLAIFSKTLNGDGDLPAAKDRANAGLLLPP
jgi:hypothetical protein